MQRQLDLLGDNEAPWRLDEETKAIGLQGVAEAREVLRRARAEARSTADRHDHATAA